MRDTQKNIKLYKEQLKHVKEKMFTAFLLFMVACTMITTTTFAWIVLSTHPEVKGITTSVSGNGNLEIALASSNEDGTAKIPDVSKAGDSKKDLLEKNITWGNLINLNDDRYGLNRIVLRPSTLNRTNTLTNPLEAVQYASDGRILKKSFDFSYASFDQNENKYVISKINNYGVRAISSVTKEVSGTAATESLQIYNDLKQKLENSKALYRDIVNDSSSEPAEKRYLSVIADLMGVFLTDKLNDSDTTIDSYMSSLYNMVNDFTETMRLLGETYVEMANIQIYKNNLTISPYTLTSLMNESESSLKSKSIPLMTGFDTFKKNYTRLTKVETGFYDEENKVILDVNKGGLLQHVEVYKSMSGVKMSQLQNDVDFLVNINTCKIDDKYTIGNMGSMGTSELLGMLSGTHTGTIVSGALKDYEQLTGEKMDARNMQIKAKYMISVTVKANIATNATAPFTVPTLIEGDGTGNDGNQSILGLLFNNLDMIETAGDIYGMSLDFWVRTNIENSYLVLEGEPVVEYQPLYTSNGYLVYEDKVRGDKFYHIPDASYPAPENPDVTMGYIPETSINYLMYGNFYTYTTNQSIEFITTDEEGNEIENTAARTEFVNSLKYSQKSIVVGYDGVNRVWEESTMLVDGTSTTQGGGSCFIFYPEDPIEQERMLKLLNALTVAFVDSNGNVLTTASLNSGKAYEEAGKITVPLELNASDSTSIMDSDGNEILTITPLEQNADMFISAIVYLDGELIENQDVSDSKNINGYLNLQFGSTEKLTPEEDENLQQEYIVVSASVDKNEFTAEQLPAQSVLTVDIVGTDASEVQVNFVRKVNNFQGVKQETITLTRKTVGEKSSTWQGTQTFTNPGTYVLRNVWVDDFEYDLEEQVVVEIPGLNITNISWNQTSNEIYKMTSDNFYNISLSANISSSTVLTPNKVEALFRNEYNEYVTINMTNTGSSWEGDGRFTSSGVYQLEFLRVNGELIDVDDELSKIIHLSLGIYATVELDKSQFDWSPINPADNIVTINAVRIFDNKDTPIQNLTNSTIHYALSGNVTNTLSSALEWHQGSETYRGQFKVINPGVYEFNKISILTADSISEIRVANAPKITSISPFSPEFDETSLALTSSYQFDPAGKAAFALRINNSSSASVAAKVYNTGTKQYYYFEAPQDHAQTETDQETGESVTTWYFYPEITVGTNTFQDGEWRLEELYITNIYYDNVFHNKAEGEWWNNQDEGYSYITWNIDDITTNILNEVNVSVTSKGRVNNDDFTGNINESLSGQYQVNGYAITYKDANGNNLLAKDSEGKTRAEKFGLTFTSNQLSYNYDIPDAILGYWKQMNGTDVTEAILKNELAKQVIDFNNNNTYTFYYPGTYVGQATISIESGSETKNITFNGTGKYEWLNITQFDISSETVTWNRPDIKFSGTYPALGTSFVYWNNGEKTGSNSLSADKKTATIFTPRTNYSVEDGCIVDKHIVTFEAPKLTMKLENLPVHGGVTCIIDNTRNGSNFKTDPTFTFSANGQEATAAVAYASATISENSKSSVNYNSYRIGNNDSAQDFTVTINGSTYKFALNGNLAVNYAY